MNKNIAALSGDLEIEGSLILVCKKVPEGHSHQQSQFINLCAAIPSGESIPSTRYAINHNFQIPNLMAINERTQMRDECFREVNHAISRVA
jgi:hypothetical protein